MKQTLDEWCANNGDRGKQLRAEFTGKALNGTKHTLKDLTIGSARSMLWRCSAGHTWYARPADRVDGDRCPYCSGKKPSAKNNFAYWCKQNPGRGALLFKEWVGKLSDGSEVKGKDFTPYSSTRVQWKCAECGHTWITDIKSRTQKGSNCLMCARAAAPEIRRNAVLQRSESLASWCNRNFVRGEQLKREWTGIAEDGSSVSMYSITYGSSVRLMWRCACGNTWVSPVNSRTGERTDCPLCSRDARIRVCKKSRSERLLSVWCEKHGDRGKQLTAEWGIRNAKGEPVGMDDITYGSDKKVLWQCKEGHKWYARVGQRTSNHTNCPYCAGAKVPYETSLSSWCENNGSRGAQLRREWTGITKTHDSQDMNSLSIVERRYKMLWKCANGHVWASTVRSRVIRGSDCPMCRKSKKKNK